jgi:hypothetical protein
MRVITSGAKSLKHIGAIRIYAFQQCTDCPKNLDNHVSPTGTRNDYPDTFQQARLGRNPMQKLNAITDFHWRIIKKFIKDDFLVEI